MQTKPLIEMVREYGDARQMAASLASIGSEGARSYWDNADRLYAEIAKRIESANHAR